MKKNVFYPILFSFDPILLLLTGNLSVLPVNQLFPSILIILFFTTIWYRLLYTWLKDIHRSGYVTFLTVFWFFYYGFINQFLNILGIGSNSLGFQLTFFSIWTLFLLLLSSRYLWKKVTSPQTITLFLNIVCVLITAYTLSRISIDIITRNFYKPDLLEMNPTLIEKSQYSETPDIYYLILDGYGRGDVLNDIYQFDNSAFLKSLIDRGFYIATDSYSNYMQTSLSLASSLNMSYITGIPRWLPDRGPLIEMIKDSRVWELFKDMGYKRIALSSGYMVTDLINADYYYSSPNSKTTNDLVGTLLNNSIVSILINQGWMRIPITRVSDGQERIQYAFSSLANEIPLITGPKFVFTHITAPHPPFIFNQKTFVDPNSFYILFDGNAYIAGSEMYIKNYINQLIYINHQVLETIDSILKNSSRSPIIIIQSDHGPGAYLDIQSVENTCLKERFSILNAIYFPDHASKELKVDITAVNTFPIIFNSLFKTNIVFQENREYFSTSLAPYAFTEVTDEVQIPCIKR